MNYYGLSYSRSRQPEESTYPLDFSWWQFRRLYPPEAFYRPNGVERFDYYIDFVDTCCVSS